LGGGESVSAGVATKFIHRTQRSMMSDKTDIQTEDEGAVANSSNRLVRRFGWQRVFRAADKVEAVRRSDWYRWCVANPHPSGSPGIYRPDAIKMARRAAHAHQIASDIFHEFILPNVKVRDAAKNEMEESL